MKIKSISTIATVFTVLMVLGTQLLPFSGLMLDEEAIQLVDFTDAESDEKEEKEKEENKEGKEKIKQVVTLSLAEQEQIFSRSFRKNLTLPSTPFFEILGPPPDLV